MIKSLSLWILNTLNTNFFIDYTSIELELDIDINFSSSLHNLYSSNNSYIISPSILGTKRNIEELDINSHGNSGIY